MSGRARVARYSFSASLIVLGHLLTSGHKSAGHIADLTDSSYHPEWLDAEPRGYSPTKRALIIAIADYPRRSNLKPLHSYNDTTLIRGALIQQGFDPANIRVISDDAATYVGILEAIRGQLIEPSEPGDILYLHYSGHGTRVADRNGDEEDQCDEALIPFDAPPLSRDDYDGSLHLIDDTLGDLVDEMRRAAGPTGNVVIVIDACFSGSITRFAYEAPVRGDSDACARRPTERGPPGPDSLKEASSAGNRGPEPEMAPYVLFSAARHDQSAIEVRNPEGDREYVGALTLALSRSLYRATPSSTYSDLLADISSQMPALLTSQIPNVEGSPDTELFSGEAVWQQQFLEIGRSFGDSILLKGGYLSGATVGSVVEFHPAGTRSPDGSPPIGRGEVIGANSSSSTVRLEEPMMETSAWAFVTRTAFGGGALGLSVSPDLDSTIREDIERQVGERSDLILVDESPDLVVRRTESQQDGAAASVTLELAAETRRLGAWPEGHPVAVADSIVSVASRFATARFLMELEIKDPDIDVRLDILPARHHMSGRTCRPSDSERLPPEDFRGSSGQWEFEPGEDYLIEIFNQGSRQAYVVILDIMADGRIKQYYPRHEATSQSNVIEVGVKHGTGLCYRATVPYGTEILKLFATSEYVDFRPLLDRRREAPMASLPRNGLEALLWQASDGRRGAEQNPSALGTTFALPIQIARKRE